MTLRHIDLSWQIEAKCSEQDTELFYADYGSVEYRQALVFCQGCPVRAECLSYAIETNEVWGIWGGATPAERRRIKRKGGASWILPISQPAS